MPTTFQIYYEQIFEMFRHAQMKASHLRKCFATARRSTLSAERRNLSDGIGTGHETG